MLQQQQTIFLYTNPCSFTSEEKLFEIATHGSGMCVTSCGSAMTEFTASAEDGPETDDADSGLEDAARTERDYLRQRLREELRREPTEQELDEWLRQHTEGY